MSSPSSSSHAGKRKRPTTATSSKMDDNPLLQPSSRDASGEEGDTTAPESGKLSHHHHHRKSETNSANSNSNSNPAKRQRANSDRNSALAGLEVNTDHTLDPGEPSDTTEASIDIADRVGKKARKSTTLRDSTMQDIDERKEQDAMPPPPVGNLIHPVGYKTNPPPTDRTVRVYADGVFDLFHLGYVVFARDKPLPDKLSY